jgi:molybdate transport system substrate-binding protein
MRFGIVGPLLLVLLAAACGSSDARTGSLRILAASSLRDVLDEAGESFQRERGIEVVVVTGGSNLVADQLAAGAPADVFFSASALEVDRLIKAGLLRADSRRDVLRNSLVVVAPAGAGASLAKDPLAGIRKVRRLSIAHPEAVPLGRYAKTWLVEAGLWEDLKSRCVYALDARAALAAVASGGTDAGIVYRSDAYRSQAVQVVYEVPVGEGADVVYPAAITTAGNRPEDASAFLEFLVAEQRASLERAGFEVIPQH